MHLIPFNFKHFIVAWNNIFIKDYQLNDEFDHWWMNNIYEKTKNDDNLYINFVWKSLHFMNDLINNYNVRNY